MATKRNPDDTPFTKEQIIQWKSRFDIQLVDAYAEYFDAKVMEDALELVLKELIDGNAFDRAFLNANLSRRQSEAQMVQAEVRIFNATADLMEQSNVMRNRLSNSLGSEQSVSALSTINDMIGNTAELIKALAQKNNTMGEGVPGGGTTTGPGGTAIPEDSPSGGTTIHPPCYEKYRRRIAELWDQKDQMGDSLMWGLQWADALKDLALCAGPKAVKLLLDMLAAAKK